MSRSRKKTPIVSVTCCDSSKAWRTQENQRYRAYVRDMIAHERYDDIQGFCGKFGNEWDSPRDGKYWYDNGKGKPCNSTIWFSRWGIIVPTCDVDSHYKCDVEYKKQMRK